MEKIDNHRRKWLTLGGAALGISLLPHKTLATLSTSRPRLLKLNNLHTGESIKSEYFNGHSYNKKELTCLNYFFRDFRANEVKHIDPNLFDQLYRLKLLLDTNKPVQLVSGYRSPKTNNALRQRSSGVAKHSLHTLGKAMDFHIEGVALNTIRKAALNIRAGGVGYYPRSNFVHIDTGQVRAW
ncbi:YcbK family protein [Candidatus Fukatsuia endosymbiont of Tuberolachnus salignus]|uniref:YcbK family protein n=1 Tax=Candidatus Fukatsuia endosymbiont of Tuberolachnus salignus TaxID=3077957 RepID=UPI00313BACAA